MNLRIQLALCSGIAALMLLSGCSSVVNSHTQKEDLLAAYTAGNQPNVESELADFLDSAADSGDEVMWQLEAGRNDFLEGRDAASFAHFSRAQALMEDFDQRAIVNLRETAANGAMLLTNPNTLPYQGLCRDRVLMPVYMALACLGEGKEADFRVEIYHLREVEDKVIRDYADYFQAEQNAIAAEKAANPDAAACSDVDKILADQSNAELQSAINASKAVAHKGYGHFLNPLGIYLSGYTYWRDGDYENALVDFERLIKAMPDHPWVRCCYAAALRLAHREVPQAYQKEAPLEFAESHDNILVIFANGRSGAFKQFSLYLPVYYAGWVTLAAVAWPLCEYYPAPFSTLTVSADGKSYETLPLADMDAILSEEYHERLPGIITRIVLSTAAKEISSYIAIAAANQASNGAGLAVALTTAAYKAVFNTADTRSWEMLPKEYQIVQLPTPEERKITLTLPGMPPHTVTLSPEAKSAILYVNAPSDNASAFRCRVLEMRSK